MYAFYSVMDPSVIQTRPAIERLTMRAGVHEAEEVGRCVDSLGTAVVAVIADQRRVDGRLVGDVPRYPAGRPENVGGDIARLYVALAPFSQRYGKGPGIEGDVELKRGKVNGGLRHVFPVDYPKDIFWQLYLRCRHAKNGESSGTANALVAHDVVVDVAHWFADLVHLASGLILLLIRWIFVAQ
jgi:hypothetical protein